MENHQMNGNQKYVQFQDEDENQYQKGAEQKYSPKTGENTDSQYMQYNSTAGTQPNQSARDCDIEMQQTQQQQQPSQEEQMAFFFEKLVQYIGEEEAQKLQEKMAQMKPEEMEAMGGMMGDVSEEQLEQQLEMFKGKTADQIIKEFEQLAQMDPEELKKMQEQMANLDEMDRKAIEAFMEIEQEMEYWGKPWRYLNEYGFYGFTTDSFTFWFTVFSVFIYIYTQQINLLQLQDNCKQIVAGGMLPYLVKQQGEYFRLFTSMFVYYDYDHFAASILNNFYLFFMIERPFKDWRKFFILLVVSQVGSQLNSINFSPDEVSVGNESLSNTLTVLLFYFSMKYKDQLMGNKFFTFIMALYFVYYAYYIVNFRSNNFWLHIGSLITGILVQPWCISLTYGNNRRLNKNGKIMYGVLLGLYFTAQFAGLYFLPYTMGPKTEALFKQCPMIPKKFN